jgi:hypothetical protein
VSRPHTALPAPAVEAREQLTGAGSAAFDRLAAAMLSPPHAPLAGALRTQLPGTAGVRWLRQHGLPPTARAGDLDAEQWVSLFRCWESTAPAPRGGRPAPGAGRRPSAHGHAPGASAIPRYY